ncbi:cingulin-like protein 1 [Spea bombifrons]|uniref:cingulin-like protein 1 n=1 Tax=Spea bombifrons TaxID=233779 RepID=UPI00234B8567|nr:cingulin-like protein 1 [Spea bombifrons]
MSYRVCNGYVSLPSRYSPCGIHQYNVDTGRRSPRWVSKDLGSIQHEMESPRPFALSELERHIEAAGHYSRGIESPRQLDRSRSVSPLRGIHSLEHSSKFPFGTEYAKNLPSPPLSRQHSLSRLPAASLDESGLELSLGHRGWSRSSLDLRASLTESAQSRAGLVQCLKEAKEKLEGQSEELRKRDKELELSKAKIDMLALKQKQLEGSISELEKEKGWLEVSRYEDKKQRGELQDRIVNLEIEVMRAKSNLENLNYTNMFTNQKNATYSNTVTASAVPKENDGMVQELRTARENLLFFRNRVKGLEAEKNRALEELRTLREGSQLALSQTNEANQRATDTIQAQQNMQEELTDLQIKYNSANLEKELLSSKVMRLEEKVSDLGVRLKIAQTDKERFLQEKLDLHRRTQELSLELERAQRGREGFNDQVSDLHIELVGAKAQANRQDQEKVQMKEELVLLKQVNDRLTLELGQTQQKLQSCMDELHQIQAEHKISTNLASALEAERAQLLAEKQLLQTAVLNDEESDSIRELRSSREQLQEERDALRTRCNTLEVALEQAHEQMGNQIQEQQQVTLYWKERWQQAALNLKNAEEKLEQTSQKDAEKSTELLQECEMLQAGTEELSELRATVNSLKEENNQLKKTIKKQEQSNRLQHLQSDIQTTMDDNTEEVNYPQNELSAQLQRT